MAGYGITDAYTKLETDAKAIEIAQAECARLVASAPETLNTLDEIAAALGDDPNFNATDWDHYEDGSEVTNGIEDGNDMVELPDAYYTVVVHGDYDWEIRMSLYPLEGYTKFSKK